MLGFVYGFADANRRDVHLVYGGESLAGDPRKIKNGSYQTWLEDADGTIDNHVDP